MLPDVKPHTDNSLKCQIFIIFLNSKKQQNGLDWHHSEWTSVPGDQRLPPSGYKSSDTHKRWAVVKTGRLNIDVFHRQSFYQHSHER